MQNKNLTPLARRLRKTLTPEERKIWYHVRNGRFQNYKFRRQFPIDKYIADFVCLSKRLIIEADGGQHNQSESDPVRDKYFHGQNFRVLRFWNNEINNNLKAVLEKIWMELQS